jgi:S-adenosylmethionine:tRNA ribosyltransferase-isomerase
VLVSDFDFPLPPELIAQHPKAERAASRMLHMRGNLLRDSVFSEFPALLRATDLLVMNDTRVLPARLFGHRSGSRAQRLSPHNPASRGFLHGQVEVLLTRRLAECPQPERQGLAVSRLPGAGEEQIWQALVRPGRKIMPGERLYFGAEAEGEALLEAEVVERCKFGERTLRFSPVPDFFARLERLGHIPLPPYIDREDTVEDRERYQTVFARAPGSVAAPTAGLHFTDEILARLREKGVETASVTLHVGLGTFAPIRTEVVEAHKIHTEWYQIPEETAEKIARAKREGRRVVAVGTTTVRTLEYAAGGAQEQEQSQDQLQGQLPHIRQQRANVGHPRTLEYAAGRGDQEQEQEQEQEQDQLPHIRQQRADVGHPRTLEYAAGVAEEQGQEQSQLPHPSQRKARMGHPTTIGHPQPQIITAHSGEADIFIYPGYQFQVVDAMLTNFHLPKSTLLMLVSAFAGRERVLAAYAHAVRERYRFFSYGDCMFIEPE